LARRRTAGGGAGGVGAADLDELQTPLGLPREQCLGG
jgi:hypothetical protein